MVETRPVQPAPLAAITALVFDVLGTVVDQSGSIREQAGEILSDAKIEDEGIPSLIERSGERLDALMAAVRRPGAAN